ncbi:MULTISPECIES: flagellar hook capping FlgD N-terminal domain-containing protein [Paenibacillus]|uniref:flagellar hook capping FlgD N-terminal domain-containing protein n=1 Tax=Paenibacillus TaxID=44249 RepID=UPI002DBCB520|nr:flagellar hook capping FlgD N-terminal domain-containing protein [Paenibacillus odorifer]MEC0133189.1 flagellar hook capping FlgD N-terminal domain-containing protein [Paenibacillus odorifer]MEC0223222.1 flagellar hook capping FlgD N-terminal domain-containing protein [Paenibacillus odorifer]
MATTVPVSTKDQWNYTTPDSSARTTGNSTLGKDQFLKILITQLQNQDPMQPMEDKEFIAQMAQFTSVEQLMNISTQLNAMNQSLGSVSGLIGKDITWTDTATKLPKTGNVESIVVSNGIQYAVVGKDRISLTDITQIQNAAATPESVSGTDSNTPENSGGSGASI